MDPLVIALGGNALLKKGEKPTYSTQIRNVRRAVKQIAAALARSKAPFVITHGNGPQVGEEFLRNIYAKQMPKLPLYLLNAETQAVIGSMIEQAMREELNRLNSKKQITTVLTHVLVDRNDPAFRKPTKPIGPFYTREELEKELKIEKFSYVKEKGMFRRVAPSPAPKEIMELGAISSLAQRNVSVICCGGGGIPITKNDKVYAGASAVIDKDMTASLLASRLSANNLIILTDVDYVRDPKTNKPIKSISAKRLKAMISEFEEGTMRPKAEACINFAENSGGEATIGNLSRFNDTLMLKGISGSRITPSRSSGLEYV